MNRTRDEALAAAGRIWAQGCIEQAARTPREAAAAAYVPGGPSIDELEQRIRRRRAAAMPLAS